mgnify:CR=1 FL=1
MIVLDTTVLSYAVGVEHPLRDPCRRVLEAHGSGLIEATTTIEVLHEFAHVRARRRPRSNAVALARGYREAFQLLTTHLEDLELGLTLFERHPRLGIFDAMLAAVAINRRAAALISADQAFGDVAELTWVDPATSALGRLIGG